jgi:hypothetical protein
MKNHNLPWRLTIAARCFCYGIICWETVTILRLVFRGDRTYLTCPADDFYYYGVIARNIVSIGRCTFDGFTATNGFHPLWMAILAGCAWLSGGTGPAFFVIVFLLSSVLLIVSIELLLRLFRRLFPNSLFIPALCPLVLFNLWGVTGLMETVVAVPLYYYLLLRISKIESIISISSPQYISFGFLSSLLVLARSDAALFIGLMITGWWYAARMPLSDKIKCLGYFCLGGILLPVYLASNLFMYGNVFPISMLAKSLKVTALPSYNFIAGLIYGARFTNKTFWLYAPLAATALIVFRKRVARSTLVHSKASIGIYRFASCYFRSFIISFLLFEAIGFFSRGIYTVCLSHFVCRVWCSSGIFSSNRFRRASVIHYCSRRLQHLLGTFCIVNIFYQQAHRKRFMPVNSQCTYMRKTLRNSQTRIPAGMQWAIAER